ncbi:MAG: endonuclease/exonuclease/phosphatase [Planctomycetaceae bacterium]|nr:endonuclease/exonuclease/phosphatase [Planctomycetaceae bacterium]
MGHTRFWLIAVILVGGGWLFHQNYQIARFDGGLQIIRRPLAPAGPGSHTAPQAATHQTIRIASWNAHVLGRSKLEKSQAINVLCRIIRRYDIIAIQDIRARTDDVIPRLVELVNLDNRNFDYVIGPRVGRAPDLQQFAFLFDRDAVEVDRHQLYVVNDPDDLLRHEPLVAWFRVRGPSADQAFTFSLVNTRVDPDRLQPELDKLDDVYRAVLQDGRGEDDVLLLGDFGTDDKHLGQLGAMADLYAVLSQIPSDTERTRQLDNLLFERQATREFTGQGGCFDFLREYNLSLQEALEVSTHLPVWAEFSIHEGGIPGKVAGTQERIR